MSLTNITWSKTDPRGTDPVAGKDGHFDNHVWLKEGTVQAHEELAALLGSLNAAVARIATLEAKVQALEAKVP